MTVRPDLELAFLKLYPGAVIKGKPVSRGTKMIIHFGPVAQLIINSMNMYFLTLLLLVRFHVIKDRSKSKISTTYTFQNKDTRNYHMKIPDVDKFEARLRKAEDDLGIKPGQGVPVTFVHDQPG